ncbi:MAG: SLC13 family permease [Planctomycetota bacterium]
MAWEAWLTIVIVVVMAGAMLRRLAGPDTVLLAGLAVVMALGEFFPASDGQVGFPGVRDAVAGFGSKAVVTIGVLFVLAEGMRQTGAMALLTRPVLGNPNSLPAAQFRLMLPVAGLSAFLNNTPIVAMLMPVVSDWCRRTGFSPSKLFIPLSYAAIMGGSCTLIGTATNVFVYGEYSAVRKLDPALGGELGMFSIAWVGVPAAIVGIGYLLLASRWLLPDRASVAEQAEARRYTFEMQVEPDSSIEGLTVEQAGLRQLPGAYIIAIERTDHHRIAVTPDSVLRSGDILVFAGALSSMDDVSRTKGLTSTTREHTDDRGEMHRFEAVISDRSPLARKSVREGRFRTEYGAAVVAVHRGGAHIEQKIGDIVLQPGDTLLLEADKQFALRFRNRPDFYYVHMLGSTDEVRARKAWIALSVLALVVLAATTGAMQLVTAALLGGGVMVLTGCCSPHEARASVNWRVLIMMGAAIGFGKALGTTGAAEAIAMQVVDLFAGMGPHAILAAIYLVAMLMTTIIGPVPTAGLMFPVVCAIAQSQGYALTPFAVTLMMTAAASFASPSAYQTNLMVYSVGGYRPMDYVRVGLPLNFIVMALTIAIVPAVWKF